MLLAVDFHEDFIDEEGITVTSVFPFQALYIFGTELDAPQPDGFVADDDSSLGQEVLDVSVTEIEAIVEPDSVGNDIWWESVAFVCVHSPILPTSVSLLVNTRVKPQGMIQLLTVTVYLTLSHRL